MGGRRQVHGINNWFIATSSPGLIARRQIVLATPDKDQEALLCKLVLELCPITIPGSSYKAKGKVWPIVGSYATRGKEKEHFMYICDPLAAIESLTYI